MHSFTDEETVAHRHLATRSTVDDQKDREVGSGAFEDHPKESEVVSEKVRSADMNGRRDFCWVGGSRNAVFFFGVDPKIRTAPKWHRIQFIKP
jgi:hypothetical protein